MAEGLAAKSAPGGGLKQKRSNVLPRNLPPRGLSRTEAAAYVGVSASLFDEMVKDSRMPRPKRVNGRTVWNIHGVDRAFDALPGGEDADSVDEWAAA